jgi:Skp family chaperone for outer membrane proteins
MKISKIIFFFIFFFNFSSSSYSENSFNYIDIDRAISQSKAGKNLLKELNTIEKNKINFFETKKNELIKEEEIIKQQQNVLSNEEIKKMVSQLKIKVKDYNKSKNNFFKQFIKKKNDELLRFVNLINPIIENYVNENSVDVLFDKKNLFMVNQKFDITDKIIVLIDAKIDSFKIN